MATAKPHVVVARLEEIHDDATTAGFWSEHGALLDAIRFNKNFTANMITDIERLDLTSITRPKAVVMVTNLVTKPNHVAVKAALAKYVSTGGTLILCCWFASGSTTWEIDGVLWEFKRGWTVFEGLEAFPRTNLTLNPGMRGRLGEEAFEIIEGSYGNNGIIAKHLKGVRAFDQVFLPSAEKDSPQVTTLDKLAEATPSAFMYHGKGFLGYVGDEFMGFGAQTLIVAMLEAVLLPRKKANSDIAPNASSPHQHDSSHGHKDRITNTGISIHEGVLAVSKKAARPTSEIENQPPLNSSLSYNQIPAIDVNTKTLIVGNESPAVTSIASIAKASSVDSHRNSNLPDSTTVKSTAASATQNPVLPSSTVQRPQSPHSKSRPSPTHPVVRLPPSRPCVIQYKDLASYVQHHPSKQVPESGKDKSGAATFTEQSTDEKLLYSVTRIPNGNTDSSVPRTPNGITETRASQTPTREEKPSAVAMAPTKRKVSRMPTLAPCNPGCTVCTILLPALKCTGCREVQYCSTRCQKIDWDEHQTVCKSQKEREGSTMQAVVSRGYHGMMKWGERWE